MAFGGAEAHGEGRGESRPSLCDRRGGEDQSLAVAPTTGRPASAMAISSCGYS